MKKIIFTAKVIGLMILLALADIILKYVVEQLRIVSVTPLTIPNYTNNHIKNILIPFPFLVVRAGWAYLIGILIYHFTQIKFNLNTWEKVFSGMLISLACFLVWWFFDPQTDLLIEGLLVYSLVGITMVLLHKYIFKMV